MISRSEIECVDTIWIVCGNRNAGNLCAGRSKPLVCPGFFRRLYPGVDLWFLAGSLAVWCGGSGLGRGGFSALAENTEIKLNGAAARRSGSLDWA